METILQTPTEITEMVELFKQQQQNHQAVMSDVYYQQNSVLTSLYRDLKAEFSSTEYKVEYTHDTISIYVDYVSDRIFRLTKEIRIRFTNESISVEMPPLFRIATSHIQTTIYKNIVKYENELLNIQLDRISVENAEKYEMKELMVEKMTEIIFDELLTKGSYKNYTMEKGDKGRYKFSNGNVEKNYYKSDILSGLRQEGRKEVDNLIRG